MLALISDPDSQPGIAASVMSMVPAHSTAEVRPSQDFAVKMLIFQISNVDLAEKNSVELKRLDDIAIATHSAASPNGVASANHFTRALLLLFAIYKHGMNSGNPARRREVGEVLGGLRYLTQPIHPEVDESVAHHVISLLADST